MKYIIRAGFVGLVAVLAILISSSAFAKVKGPSVNAFNPTTDGGKYLTMHQSNTLPQWSYNVGGTFDYAYEPLELNIGGVRQGIVDDLIMANIQGAIGWTDWWTMGANVPVALWEVYWNQNATTAAFAKQTFFGKMGDVRLEMKFRLLDIDRYHVGVSLVPYMYFPTGRSTTLLGNGMWSPGGTLVVDGDVMNRVFLTLNAGFRRYNSVRYNTINTNANTGNAITLGGGINVRINDSWGVLGEAWVESVVSAMFKNQLQNPSQWLIAGRFTPQKIAKGLGVTVGGGTAMTKGLGAPDFRVLAGVNYRHIHVPPPPPPVRVEAVVEEKIIITQKIHFEFNKSVIRPISYPILDDVADLLRRNPQIRHVRVEGHTDWIGSDAYNQKLSEHRARAVRDYLVGKGIEPDRLDAKGYGESRPIADNNTVQGRARNRRTEFTVIQ